jgi:hypothetical protein
MRKHNRIRDPVTARVTQPPARNFSTTVTIRMVAHKRDPTRKRVA